MSATPTVQEVTAIVETDLDSTAIQRLIDAEDAEVTIHYGSHTTQVDDLVGNRHLIFPSRPVGTMTSVVESIGNTDRTLDSSDYRIKSNGSWLERRNDGANPRHDWGDQIRLTYTPVVDDARRKRVIIDLVRLAIQYDAMKSVKEGDFTETTADYQEERLRILSTLSTGQAVFV